MQVTTAKQMQEIDRRTILEIGIPGRVLMESAGRGCVAALDGLAAGRPLSRVVVVAGRGNNGGDGFVVARYLAERGVEAPVFVVGGVDGISGEAFENLSLLEALGVAVVEVVEGVDLTALSRALSHCDMVVDALFGTGLQREVTGLYAEVVSAVNASNRQVLAVDIPSGVCADTGRVLGCAVRARATATFCLPKAGHFLYPGREHCGELSVVDIGIPQWAVDRAEVACRLITSRQVMGCMAPFSPHAHKGTRGHLALMGGSSGKSGAVILAAGAAVSGGAGLVSTALPACINTAFESRCLEAMSLPLPHGEDGSFHPGCGEALADFLSGKDAVAAGPGLTTSKGALAALAAVLDFCEVPMVLDADALNLLAEKPELVREIKAEAVITPHPKELARLTGASVHDIQADRMGAASAFAVQTGLHVVLKGAGTVVAHPDGSCALNPTGNALLATGGTGDVLTGLIGALLAQGFSCREASEMGVYLHGEAANRLMDQGLQTGMAASRLTELLPGVLSDAMAGRLEPRAPEARVI
ncbi:NAD(P)H-hydrate dehydratase [Desulfoluna spongiiphila]|uniref:Bifunctional NAD(P)H-hydrate repair enzyme n=1 Tax=Desulfoluna spongiiphila TaxID=419481 RepID=A0A1G5IBE4_9BACT|nr:NAD(P)H-hydrate dehydratase [Desulfoluna spongiiphila]SCY72929.1 NAD(P)H-hydrate epimerase [Desulfoluna spongiiphila]